MTSYQVITQEIIRRLEAGEIPWRKSWSTGGMGRNLISLQPYKGINALLTSVSAYVSTFWVTARQAKELGARVPAGTLGVPVVYWSITDKKDEQGNESKSFVMRYYRVYNTDQLLNVPAKLERLLAEHVPPRRTPDEACARAKEIADAMPHKPLILPGPFPAYYPAVDTVGMPEREKFESDSEYYAKMFHELAHSTGHASRLDRFKNTNFKWADHAYSREELVAELTAAFLCGDAGIDSMIIENAAAYCQHWVKAISGDARLVIDAAAQAQKAANFVMGRTAAATVEKQEEAQAA